MAVSSMDSGDMRTLLMVGHWVCIKLLMTDYGIVVRLMTDYGSRIKS